MQIEEGENILCTVDKIAGTIVFVKIKEFEEGTITFSEIAPGRIRNIRDYVVPKKQIVCKVLRIRGNRINLSLRRVTQKEKKEVLEQYKQEKSYKSIFKSVLKEKAKEIIEKIIKENDLYDFLEQVKKDPKKLEKFISKENSEKILKILKNQKQKEINAQKKFNLTTIKPNGLKLIKDILGKVENAKIKYISAGKYSIKLKGEEIKKTDNQLKEILLEVESQAKKQGMEFQIKEK
jgi:translation initiation factor 2 alpha subunit (eIF-2alpha)